MNLIATEKRTTVKSQDNNYNEVILEEVPVYTDEGTGEELVTLGDILRANERRIAKKNNVSIFNIFELALLYADVKQRGKNIRQKFRFNKMLFYVMKKLEEEYGVGTLIFDEIWTAKNGPIPAHLKDDLKQFQEDGIIDIYLVKKGKKIPGSKKNWIESKWMTIECSLTKRGKKLAKSIWFDLDPEMQEIILSVKEKLNYMKTSQLKHKVHKEYPEYRKTYIEDDNESLVEFLPT